MTAIEWRGVVGYEDIYQISNNGQVRRILKSKTKPFSAPIKTQAGNRGHLSLALYRNSHGRKMYVHRLVCIAFNGEPPPGTEVCHNNGIPSDNRPENLRWDTHLANGQDRVRLGAAEKASRTHCGKGHEFTPENTSSMNVNGRKLCKTCKREYTREIRAAKKIQMNLRTTSK